MKKLYLILALSAFVFAGCNDDSEDTNTNDTNLDNDLVEVLQTASGKSDASAALEYFTMPESAELSKIPADPNNPLTAEKVTLGKFLFHETAMAINPKITSNKHTFSCASCHHVAADFQAGARQGIGEGGVGFGSHGETRVPDSEMDKAMVDVQPERSPTALNVAYQKEMLWNGQFGALGQNIGTDAQWTVGTPKEKNVLGFDGVETQAIAAQDVHRLGVDEELLTMGYKELFEAAYPDKTEFTKIEAGLAMAAYERTLLANKSPFQQWLKGDKGAMTPAQKEGAILFFGEAGCSGCHTGPALSSNSSLEVTESFYALGMGDLRGEGVLENAVDFTKEDAGRGGFTGKEEDNYKFKVPQLYNLKHMEFFGHGGTLHTLDEVVKYKNEGVPQMQDLPSEKLSDKFVPLGLSADEVAAIVIFLEEALYDDNLQRYVPTTLPSGYAFPNNDEQSRKDLGMEQ
ncbi:cytochrome c peroxidase [Limibacter armeniacum]|uniref:cytochrome-c peroxidase n=1 Tax=Limibacter armeniacum TaxID=466084 RepID=UPI002FE5E613